MKQRNERFDVLQFLDQNDLGMFKEADKLGVKSRYSNPLRFTLMNSDAMERIMGEDLVTRVVNPEWMGNFRKLLTRLFKIARVAYKKYRSKDNALIGTNQHKRDDRFEAFYQAMKGKV